MPRLSFCLAVMATTLSLATAAPVPTHLMPKDPPFAFPTRVGTTWVFDDGGKGKTLVISRSEECEGAQLVTTEWVEDDGGRTPHMVVSVSASGVFLVEEQGEAYAAPWCILKLPHREGQAWDTRLSGRGSTKVGWMVSGPVERVKVPGGAFDAARVEWVLDSRCPARTATFWYAHGVGLVRLGEALKLVSFTPGKD